MRTSGLGPSFAPRLSGAESDFTRGHSRGRCAPGPWHTGPLLCRDAQGKTHPDFTGVAAAAGREEGARPGPRTAGGRGNIPLPPVLPLQMPTVHAPVPRAQGRDTAAGSGPKPDGARPRGRAGGGRVQRPAPAAAATAGRSSYTARNPDARRPAQAETRASAAGRVEAALQEYAVLGPTLSSPGRCCPRPHQRPLRHQPHVGAVHLP